MYRKVIQLTAAGAEWGHQVTALCDDGTVWRLYGSSDSWEKLPSIPQED